MKNKIAIASALAAASSLATAEIKINEFLSFEGFVDSSYTHTNAEFGTEDGSDNSFQVDQVEIDWLFNFNPITARVDLEHDGDDNRSSGIHVEQAFVNYDLGNGITITAGRYESVLGLEAKEPTGLYQYSTAYDFGGVNHAGGSDDFDNADWNSCVLPQYAQGVKVTYDSNGNVYSLSIQDESFDNDEGRLGGDNNEDSTYAIEAGASLDLGNGLTWFIGGAFEDGDEAGDIYVINTHLTYVTGPWTFGAEVSYGESERTNGTVRAQRFDDNLNDGTGQVRDELNADWEAFRAAQRDDDIRVRRANAGSDVNCDDTECLQALIMANYAYSDSCSITARISYSNEEKDFSYNWRGRDRANNNARVRGTYSDSVEADFLKYTLAHNNAITDNLAVITEISYVDGEYGDVDYEALIGAVEVLFTF